MENFRAKIAEIKQEASRLYDLKLDEDKLFEELNKIPNQKLDALLQTYDDSEGKPVNSMRKQVLELLKRGSQVNKSTIDLMIEEGNSSADKNSFKAWGYFSILFPIINNDLSFDVKETLRELGQEIITKLELSDVVAKPFVIDFKGPRNFGSDNIWMAIYNKSNPKQTTAVQMFLQVDYRGLICHLYDRLKDNFISSRKIDDSQNMEQQVFNFFGAVKERILQDQNINEEDRFRELGVKTNAIFKISHGREFFKTADEIQYCIDQNIVVMHDSTPSKAREKETQYEKFQNAKTGDLFYLCWGNNRFILIGQFVDEEIEDYEYTNDKGWKKRKYRYLFDAISNDPFSGSKKWWAPNDPSTFMQIPKSEYKLANDLIFRKYFKVELKNNFDTQLLPPKLGASARQKISIDEIVEPKLEVNLIARELAGVIDNLDKNKGQMIGIFGSWGRGKTFLYNEMSKHITSHSDDLTFGYEHFTFNAWKYQETETVWAHLYDSLLQGFMGNSNWWGRQWKTFRLNIIRKGWFPIVSIVLSLLITTAITYLVSNSMKFEIAKWLVAFFGGVVGVAQAIYIYWRYYQPLKETLESYTSLHNYNEVLGLQSEIQKELTLLIKFWLGKKKDGKKRKRLLLFVDDIDRCQEEKIISVLDALRVMLDNDELVERIIVLVAIDEVLLNRAILFKYRNFKFEEDGVHSKNLVEEYMDKLFIAGIKLPKLNVEEQGVILRNYAINNEILQRVTTDDGPSDVKTNVTESTQEESTDELILPDANRLDYMEEQSVYFLLEKEMALLNQYSDHLSDNVTPRQLRIYMYRYLLAKNIASDYLWQKTGESQLSDEYCDFLAKSIAFRSNNRIGFKYDEALSEKLINNPTLQIFTPKLVEMVVPY